MTSKLCGVSLNLVRKGPQAQSLTQSETWGSYDVKRRPDFMVGKRRNDDFPGNSHFSCRFSRHCQIGFLFSMELWQHILPILLLPLMTGWVWANFWLHRSLRNNSFCDIFWMILGSSCDFSHHGFPRYIATILSSKWKCFSQLFLKENSGSSSRKLVFVLY